MQSDTIKEIDDSHEKENLKKLEAVFFVSGRFLNMQELVSFTDFSPVIIQELIEKLQEKYARDDSAIEIVEKQGVWKMDVRAEHVDVINRLATGSSEFSNAEKETLAIIAYKQPIKQSVIIKIRGNKAYDHIKKFVELGLLRKKKQGHTNILSLADEFYDYFNLNEGRNPLQDENGSADSNRILVQDPVPSHPSAPSAQTKVSEPKYSPTQNAQLNSAIEKPSLISHLPAQNLSLSNNLAHPDEFQDAPAQNSDLPQESLKEENPDE